VFEFEFYKLDLFLLTVGHIDSVFVTISI